MPSAFFPLFPLLPLTIRGEVGIIIHFTEGKPEAELEIMNCTKTQLAGSRAAVGISRLSPKPLQVAAAGGCLSHPMKMPFSKCAGDHSPERWRTNLFDHVLCSYFLNDCYHDWVAVTMVLGKLSEGGPFFGLLVSLRNGLKFSALNYLWLCCSRNGRGAVPGKVLRVWNNTRG